LSGIKFEGVLGLLSWGVLGFLWISSFFGCVIDSFKAFSLRIYHWFGQSMKFIFGYICHFFLWFVMSFYTMFCMTNNSIWVKHSVTSIAFIEIYVNQFKIFVRAFFAEWAFANNVSISACWSFHLWVWYLFSNSWNCKLASCLDWALFIISSCFHWPLNWFSQALKCFPSLSCENFLLQISHCFRIISSSG